MSHFLDALTNPELSKVWLRAPKNGDALYCCLQLYTSTIPRLLLPAKPTCPCGKHPMRGKVTWGGSFIWEKCGGEKQWWKGWSRNGKRLHKARQLCEQCCLEVLVVHPCAIPPRPKSGLPTQPAVLAIPHMPDPLLRSGGPGLGCLSPAGQHQDGMDRASWYHPFQVHPHWQPPPPNRTFDAMC